MLSRRVHEEGGFGLVELLIAMTILAIGISAIVAGFSSGILAVNRASQTATAGTLADRQMELYRALPYGSIHTPPATPVCTVVGTWTPGFDCAIQRIVTGPDHRKYEVDTSIVSGCANPAWTLSGSSCTDPATTTVVARTVKTVTVTVKGCKNTACTTWERTWFTETSTFDAAT